MAQNYKEVRYGKKSIRRNYSKIRTEVELPDLLEIQTKSFEKFIGEGLKELFDDISPIQNENGDISLYFGEHHFEEPKYDIVESKLRDINYTRPLKVKVLLKIDYVNDDGEPQEELIEKELFMGDFYFMTPAGTFIVNGAERVIISQIVRSSGVYFTKEIDKKTGLTRFMGQIIPTRGAWIEYETGTKDIWYAKLDRSKKIPVTTFLRSFGLVNDKDMRDLYGKSAFLEAALEREIKDAEDRKTSYLEKNKSNLQRVADIESYTLYDWALIDMYAKLRQEEDVPPENARDYLISHMFDVRRYDLQTVGRYKYNKKLDVLQRAKGLRLAEDVKKNIVDENGEVKTIVLVKAGTPIIGDVLTLLDENRDCFRKELPIKKEMISAMATYFASDIYTQNEVASLPVVETLKVFAHNGEKEVKVNIVGNDQREKALYITLSDIYAGASYYFNLYDGIGTTDDIDHLGNRRLRLIGELLKNQFRTGLVKLEKTIKERMSTNFGRDEIENVIKELTPNEKEKKLQGLVNIKPLTSLMKEFFGSSQLSQFMDQINPLAEITQKRRISALGNGGIARDRAGVEVRDVHYTHYGRMCPIETPEGPSIGLITSLATYAKVNEYGFIESPYFKFKVDKDGRKVVTNEIVYLTADDEDQLVIAAANTKLDEQGHIIDEKVIGRRHGETEFVNREEVDYMDVSSKQIISVATSTIPFLEHDDAVRALMGANMQRQAVPIINPEPPIVGTGIEHKAAHDCGSALIAKNKGLVTYVDAKRIDIKEESGEIVSYHTYQFLRSNQDTAILQKPIVQVGDVVEANEIIADGQSMKDGELALGRNVRIGFMTWDGYNFEDAVIMSEKMVKDDVYTSIHIDKYEIKTRDTKLGKEEITREIPDVKAEVLAKYLDESGVIIPGTEVKEGDILVGKITPKGQTDPTAEERLLLAIFGEKPRDVRNTSLKVPHGGEGIVHSVKHYKKSNGDDLEPGVNEVIRVFIVKKRKIREGDKMAGRHGNKGVISRIVPEEDMPFDKYGRPLDIMLNPQGVPSRMNIGQVLEIHLGMAARHLGIKVATPVFDGVTMEELQDIMKEANMHVDEMLEKGLDPNDPKQVAEYVCDGKQILYDGRTGEPFENRISVGVMYFIKLSHMVDDKLHARSVGPYTLVTQQPMGGKAQNGGQRFGEMEVWALEAYGAAHTLREMLTVKSDDIIGRNKVFNAIVGGTPIPQASIPESFRVLTRELQSLGLHIELINNDGEDEALKSLVDEEDNLMKKLGF